MTSRGELLAANFLSLISFQSIASNRKNWLQLKLLTVHSTQYDFTSISNINTFKLHILLGEHKLEFCRGTKFRPVPFLQSHPHPRPVPASTIPVPTMSLHFFPIPAHPLKHFTHFHRLKKFCPVSKLSTCSTKQKISCRI